MLIFFSLNIGMLIMRMYALYDRSRKVLALYIVIAVVAVAVGCVSLNLCTIGTQFWHPIADVVVYSGQQWFQIKITPRTSKYI